MYLKMRAAIFNIKKMKKLRKVHGVYHSVLTLEFLRRNFVFFKVTGARTALGL